MGFANRYLADDEVRQIVREGLATLAADGRRVLIIFNHRWDDPASFLTLGAIPTTEIREVTGGRLITHARYYWLLRAEGHLTKRLFGEMVQRIAALSLPAG